jgi:hypothetical protein
VTGAGRRSTLKAKRARIQEVHGPRSRRKWVPRSYTLQLVAHWMKYQFNHAARKLRRRLGRRAA